MNPAVATRMLRWPLQPHDLPRLAVLPAAAIDVLRAETDGALCLQTAIDMAPQVAALLQPDVVCERFVRLQTVAGASDGATAGWRYVVETDVLEAQEADFNAWYAEEHLPGLAAVPGVVRAARYVRESGAGPRYHACYDLATIDAFNSPPWLAVRASAWSDRVRPAFEHTTRIMYRRVPAMETHHQR